MQSDTSATADLAPNCRDNASISSIGEPCPMFRRPVAAGA
jgi:hypothetical protein